MQRLRNPTTRSLFFVCAAALASSLASCGIEKNSVTLPPATQGASVAGSDGREFQSEQRWGPKSDNHWEPVVAADPSSKWVYQMTTQQRPDYMLFRASSDRGRTWGAVRHLCHRDIRVPFQYDPQVAVERGGAIDVVCLDGFRPGAAFARSSDRGRRWSPTVRLDGALRYSDKPTLAISPSGKDVYVAFNAFYALYVAVSHDHGASWSPPVEATALRRWYYSLSGTVAPNGAVWFAVDGETGKDETGDGYEGLVTSADRGATWRVIPFAVTHEGAPCTYKHCYPDFYTGQDAVAADRRGNLVFVFDKNERAQGPNRMFVSTSKDGGATWSAPALINAAGNNTSPALVAGPGVGDFRLVWQDDRNGRRAWNTWYARSTDAGTTWSDAVRLSDRGTGDSYKHDDGYDFPFGDYLSLAVDSHGTNHVIWGEGKAVYFPGGTWWTRGR